LGRKSALIGLEVSSSLSEKWGENAGIQQSG